MKKPFPPRPPLSPLAPCPSAGIATVIIPASLGTSADGQPYAPRNGLYFNTLVTYESDKAVYLYGNAGVPVKVNVQEGIEFPVVSVNDKTGAVVLVISDLENDLNYQTLSEVNSAIASAVSDEADARSAADSGLQSQIDALAAASDVTDIVGTYAALQAYDTSRLNDNDIIKVLQDETHDDETTYYRWHASTQTFSLIGEEGPYYTKAAADAQFVPQTRTVNSKPLSSDIALTASDVSAVPTSAVAQTTGTSTTNVMSQDATTTAITNAVSTKQDTLTAGSNITIDPTTNVISATDTTYSDFVGTDGTAAGTAGLVPAPGSTDVDKFLKSDGTWDTAGSSVNLYTSIGQNTDGAMTQKAVTDLIYANDATGRGAPVRIGGVPLTQGLGERSVVIGSFNGPGVTNTYQTCIGFGLRTGNFSSYSISIGYDAGGSESSQQYKIAIGTGSRPNGIGSIALGANTTADSGTNYSVALGYGAKVTRAGEVNIGTNTHWCGYNSTNYRVLGGVHDGIDAHDAATVGQLTNERPLTGSAAPTTATVGNYIGQLYYDATNGDLYYCSAITAQGTDPETYEYTWTAVGGGTLYTTIGQNTDGAMTQKAVTDTIFAQGAVAYGAVKIGDNTVVNGASNQVVIGQGADASASGGGAIVIGDGAKTVAGGSSGSTIAIGASNVANGTYYGATIGIGTSKYKIGSNSVALGSSSAGNGAGVVKIGCQTNAPGENSTVIGFLAGSVGKVGDESVEIGYVAGNNNSMSGSHFGAVFLGSRTAATLATPTESTGCGTALGHSAITYGYGSVALGAKSQARVKGEVNISTSTTDYAYDGASSVATTDGVYTRVIRGVHDGVQDDDAVTVGQLNTAIAGVGTNTISSTDWSNLWQ